MPIHRPATGRTRLATFALAIALVAGACGGSGSEDESFTPPPPSASATTIVDTQPIDTQPADGVADEPAIRIARATTALAVHPEPRRGLGTAHDARHHDELRLAPRRCS